jgi:putative endopeptidase
VKPFGLLLLIASGLQPVFGQAADFKSPSESGIDLSSIDKSVDPCEDFYQYACGHWLKNNPIPSDQPSWGHFNELEERNEKILKEIAEDSAEHTNRSALDQKIGDFYGSCMAEGEIEALGTKPLEDELKRIKGIETTKELIEEVARLHERQIEVFFEFGALPDPDNSKMEMAGIDQDGLGLPEKEYYFRTDENSIELRKKYVAHIARMFELIDIPATEASQKADSVMKLETDLAKGSLDVVQRRDPKNLIHKYKTDRLSQLSPHLKMGEYFVNLDMPAFSVINVASPDFIRTMDAVINSRPLEVLKDYMIWQYLHSSAPALPKSFVNENFDFYGRTLTGTPELRPRWKRCVAMTDDELGEAIGKRFVERTFGKEGKVRTLEMVMAIEHQMALDIESLTWMSAETKREALEKLKGVTNKIGYPEKWRDYSKLEMKKGDYLGNIYRARQFETQRDRLKIGKPVDPFEWVMTPPTVNAYYDPTQNNINFPAGILQPPFYFKKADDAVNYGGIGTVVGHELTHGFDDEGRQFDATGNLRDWWQKQDEERFKTLADCIIREYSNFQPLPGVYLNGKLTLGENTADNGGLRLAYMGLLESLTKHTEAKEEKDGYTTAQRFFIGWAQSLCENQRPELERLLIQTDPHSPPKYGVNGVAKNAESFTEAWGCKPDQSMFAASGKACRVW